MIKRRGFTLIELLVVIAIIGVLSTLAIIALGSARQKSRDSKRVADLAQIGKALELYYADANAYPTLITPGQPLKSADGATTYMASVPSNPSPQADGNCPVSDYVYRGGQTAYSLTSCLGGQSGSIAPGIFFGTSQGSASCGVPVVDRDGNAYKTVQIGTQCWFAENLRSRTKPDGSGILPLGSNSSLRDCIGAGNVRGTESDCAAGYALYTWAGAMNGSTTEGAQGMCPDGWHVPSDAEQNTLDQALVTVGQVCDPARSTYSCNGAGTNMRNLAGFNAVYTGQRNSNGSVFSYYGQILGYWSSTQSTTLAYDRAIYSGINSGTTVYRGADLVGYAQGVRCLKN